MKLAISELAWPESVTDLQTLNELGINFIETVIPKHVDWNLVDFNKFNQFIENLALNNIDVKSTQSITYNSNITSFVSNNFVEHIQTVSDICYQMDITTIVLGAPALRLEYNQQLLSDKFAIIDSILQTNNQTLLIEPNSRIYNGEYFFTVDEIVKFIKMNNFTNIKTMIDTHNILLEGQTPADVFIKYHPYIKHVHVSENKLSSFRNAIHHQELSTALHDMNYDGLVVYECMKSHTLLGDIKLFSYIYNK